MQAFRCFTALMKWICLVLASMMFSVGCGDDSSASRDASSNETVNDGSTRDSAMTTVDDGGSSDASLSDASTDGDGGEPTDGGQLDGSSGEGSTCRLASREGCCFDDSDCMRGQQCHRAQCTLGGEGVCKPPLDAGCWSNRDCTGRFTTCSRARICGCGVRCMERDQPGTCSPIIAR